VKTETERRALEAQMKRGGPESRLKCMTLYFWWGGFVRELDKDSRFVQIFPAFCRPSLWWEYYWTEDISMARGNGLRQESRMVIL
jgi:hypothetical protein